MRKKRLTGETTMVRCRSSPSACRTRLVNASRSDRNSCSTASGLRGSCAGSRSLGFRKRRLGGGSNERIIQRANQPYRKGPSLRSPRAAALVMARSIAGRVFRTVFRWSRQSAADQRPAAGRRLSSASDSPATSWRASALIASSWRRYSSSSGCTISQLPLPPSPFPLPRPFPRRLRRPVALLELLAATAGARVVTAHARVWIGDDRGADRGRLAGRQRPRGRSAHEPVRRGLARDHRRGTPPRRAAQRARHGAGGPGPAGSPGRRPDLDAELEPALREGAADVVHQAHEHLVCRLLLEKKKVLLAPGAVLDRGAQLVEIVEVILPLLVDHGEHDV